MYDKSYTLNLLTVLYESSFAVRVVWPLCSYVSKFFFCEKNLLLRSDYTGSTILYCSKIRLTENIFPLILAVLYP